MEELSCSNERIFKIPIGIEYQSWYDEIRGLFAKMMMKVIDVIRSHKLIKIKALKKYLDTAYHELRGQLPHVSTVYDVLKIVCNHCSLINCEKLKAIADYFKIPAAQELIEIYYNEVETFCKKIKIKLEIKAKFCACDSQTYPIHERHMFETIEFMVNWDADKATLEGFQGLLEKRFNSAANHVRIVVVSCSPTAIQMGGQPI